MRREAWRQRRYRLSEKVVDLTVEELRRIVEEAVERIVLEMLVDPDAGLEIRPEFAESLRAEVSAEGRGETAPAEEVLADLGEGW